MSRYVAVRRIKDRNGDSRSTSRGNARQSRVISQRENEEGAQ